MVNRGHFRTSNPSLPIYMATLIIIALCTYTLTFVLFACILIQDIFLTVSRGGYGSVHVLSFQLFLCSKIILALYQDATQLLQDK